MPCRGIDAINNSPKFSWFGGNGITMSLSDLTTQIHLETEMLNTDEENGPTG